MAGGGGYGGTGRSGRPCSGGSMRSRWVRAALLCAVCVAPVVVEASVLRSFRYVGSLAATPQASALRPFATLHDLRWVLVYHNTWASFVGESAAAIVERGLFASAAVALAWPMDLPRPPALRLIGRNLAATALIGALLSPWA